MRASAAFRVFVWCALLGVVGAKRKKSAPPPGVLNLEYDDFEGHRAKFDVIMVRFWWPPGVKTHLVTDLKLERPKQNDESTPVWADLAKRLQPANAAGVVAAQMDAASADADFEWLEEQGVDPAHLPQYRLFKRGIKDSIWYNDFLAEAQGAPIAAFAAQWAGPSPKRLTSADEVDAFLTSPRSIVYFHTGKPHHHVLTQATHNRTLFQWGIVDVATASVPAEYLGPTGVPSLRMSNHRAFEPVPEMPLYAERDGKGRLQALPLMNWVVDHCRPPVMMGWQLKRCPEASVPKEGELKHLVYIFIQTQAYSELDVFEPYLHEFSKGQRRHVAVMVEHAETSSIYKQVPFKDHKALPKAAVMTPDGVFYTLEENVNATGLAAFLEDFGAGRSKTSVWSQPLSDHTTSAGLTTVVGHSFDRWVADHWQKDLLLLLCKNAEQACRDLQGPYAELAEAVAGEETLVVGMMDTDRNDPNYEIVKVYDGSPVVFLLPARGSETARPRAKKYTGGDGPGELLLWVRQCTKHPLSTGRPVADADEGNDEL